MHGVRPKREAILLSVALSLATLYPLGSACATTGPAAASVPARYSDQPSVIEYTLCRVTFSNDGTSTREETSRIRILSAAGVENWGLVTFGYNSANQDAEVRYVRVIKPDGTIISTPLMAVQDVTDEVTRYAPEYSDYHEKHIPVKGLSPGDELEYQ